MSPVFHLYPLINSGFRTSRKLAHGFGSDSMPVFPKVGAPSPATHPPPPLLSPVHFTWPDRAVLFHSFPESSPTSRQSLRWRHYLLLQHGWLYCKLKNKQVLSGCTLLSASLHLSSPYPVALPQSRALSSPPIGCLFVLCLLSPVLLRSSETPTPNPHIL